MGEEKKIYMVLFAGFAESIEGMVGMNWEIEGDFCVFVHTGTLGEGIGTPWLRPFQKVKKP